MKFNVINRVKKLERAILDPIVTEEQKARLLEDINRRMRRTYGESGEDTSQDLTAFDLEHLPEFIAAGYAQADAEWAWFLAEHPGEDPAELRATANERDQEENHERFKRRVAFQARRTN